MVSLDNLRQSIRMDTARDGGGGSPPRLSLNKYRSTSFRVTLVEVPWHVCTPVDDPTYATFKEYKDVHEMEPLEVLEYGVMWFA